MSLENSTNNTNYTKGEASAEPTIKSHGVKTGSGTDFYSLPRASK